MGFIRQFMSYKIRKSAINRRINSGLLYVCEIKCRIKLIYAKNLCRIKNVKRHWIKKIKNSEKMIIFVILLLTKNRKIDIIILCLGKR